MKKHRVRLTRGAERDLVALQDVLFRHDASVSLRLLESFPFTCRNNEAANDLRFRELVVPFGNAGYVVLFEIEDARTVTVLAARRQREDDHH